MDGYKACKTFHGKDMFQRMRDKLEDYVKNKKEHIFNMADQRLRIGLQELEVCSDSSFTSYNEA